MSMRNRLLVNTISPHSAICMNANSHYKEFFYQQQQDGMESILQYKDQLEILNYAFTKVLGTDQC